MSLARYLVKRSAYSLLTLFIVITATFLLMHAIPGSAYTSEKTLAPSAVRNIEAKYGFDKPLYIQYFKQIGSILRLDFGMSMKNEGISVNEVISRHFPKSAALGLFAICLCLLSGIPLGVVSALHKDKWQDRASMIIATIGVTVPGFVVATLTQYFLGLKLRLFPVMGLDSLRNAILPAIALSFFPLSFIARIVRSGMIEVLGQDYIRTARAKGLSESAVICKHALKNALIPVATYLGPLIAAIFTGSFVIERIFNIPGLGSYYVDSISNRDYTMIMGVTVFYAFLLIVMNLAVDIAYSFIDPRIKFSAL